MVKQESGSGKVRREVEWRERLARFAVSGQQVKEFCDRESESAASLYRWRKLLDHDAVVADTVNFIDVGALGSVAPEEALLDTPGESGGAALEVRLDLGHGLTLHIVRR